MMGMVMTKALVIAASLGLALATTGCAEMAKWQTGGDGGTHMGGYAPVEADVAGTATLGTGSSSVSGEDRRHINATGQGLDG
jgi:hypothetical protein